MPGDEGLKGRRTHESQQLSIGLSPIMPWFEGINRPKDALKYSSPSFLKQDLPKMEETIPNGITPSFRWQEIKIWNMAKPGINDYMTSCFSKPKPKKL